MVNVFLADGGLCENIGISGTGGTAMPATSVANTKTAWIQLTAATSFNYDAIDLILYPFADQVLLDLATGAAASEVVVLSNFMIGKAQSGIMRSTIPLQIPSGSRVAARCQSATNAAAGTAQVAVTGYASGGPKSFAPAVGRWEPYGVVTGTSRGTAVASSGTPGALGAWVQITASTLIDHGVLMVVPGFQPAFASGVIADQTVIFDVGVGGAGSEQVIPPRLWTLSSSYGGFVGTPPWFVPCDVPSGSRLAVRASSAVANATYSIFDIVIYGAS